MLHSRVAKVLTFPPLTFVLFVLSPWALYFTGWYDATLHSSFLHELMHVHLVVVGALFFTPILGVDPVPGRVSYPFRMLLLVLTLPFHAFLGVTIMGQTAADRRRLVPVAARLDAWLPDPHDDQHLAGGILWGVRRPGRVWCCSAVLFVQWVRVVDGRGPPRGPAAGPARTGAPRDGPSSADAVRPGSTGASTNR